MKKIKLYLTGLFLIGVFVIACKKNDVSSFGDSASQASENAKLKNKLGNEEPLVPSDPLEVQHLEQLAGFDFSATPPPSTEYDATLMLAPMMINSKAFFYEMGLSNSDLLEEFSSLDDYDIAYVALVMNQINAMGGIPGCDSGNLLVKCLVTSALPCDLFAYFPLDARTMMIQQGFNAAYKSLSIAAKKAVIRTIGAHAIRHFGGGGLSFALFIYDFSSCLINGGYDEVPTPTLILIEMSAMLPLPLGNFYSYCVNEEGVLDTVNDLWLETPIFQNPANNKYYSDSGFTSYVPNGYYRVMYGSSDYKYHKLIDGEAIAVYVIE